MLDNCCWLMFLSQTPIFQRKGVMIQSATTQKLRFHQELLNLELLLKRIYFLRSTSPRPLSIHYLMSLYMWRRSGKGNLASHDQVGHPQCVTRPFNTHILVHNFHLEPVLCMAQPHHHSPPFFFHRWIRQHSDEMQVFW
jgi:hypothetical protein